VGRRRGAAPLRSRGGSAFREGLFSNLLNPKIAVFYTSVIPQFVVAGDPVLLPALLAAIHIATGVIWLPAYGFVVTRARRFLARPRLERAIARVTGAVLVALGVRLALDRR
jgi:threonine/homoserine/homoserine lactone efflux protein